MATVTLQKAPPFQETPSKSIIGPVTKSLYVADAMGRVTVDTQDSPYLFLDGWAPLQAGSGAGTLATSGVAILDFGAFPGQPMASLVVANPDVANPNAQIDAWVIPVATVDHTADEHVADGPAVAAAYTTPGTSFTITCTQNAKTLTVPPGTPFGGANSQQPIGQQQLNPYGKWSIAWAFSP